MLVKGGAEAEGREGGAPRSPCISHTEYFPLYLQTCQFIELFRYIVDTGPFPCIDNLNVVVFQLIAKFFLSLFFLER